MSLEEKLKNLPQQPGVYLHKNADLCSFTQDDLDDIAAKLNDRPRRVLSWATPAQALTGAARPLTGWATA